MATFLIYRCLIPEIPPGKTHEKKTYTNIQNSNQNQYVYVICSVSSKTTPRQNMSLLYFTTGF